MSVINQLLSKAMSTSSDEEAIACLKMARKKGNVFDVGGTSTYNGHTAEYWYEKAATYYNVAKKKQEPQVGLSAAQQQQLYNMYKNSESENVKLYEKAAELRSENKKLKQQLEAKKNEYLAGTFFGLMVAMIPAVILAILI